MIKTTNVEMYDIAGVDLRNDEPFEIQIAVDANTSVELYYTQRGYRLTKAACIGTMLFLSSGTDAQRVEPATQPTEPPAAQPAKTKEPSHRKKRDPDTGSTEHKKKGAAARLYEYIRLHPEQGVIKAIADATMAKLTEDDVRDMANGKATPGSRWKTIAAALDILEKTPAAPEQMQVKHDFEEIINSVDAGMKKKVEPDAEGLGAIDEEKLRRRTQAALKTWIAKNGWDKINTLRRATGNRVTEDTLKAMAENSDAGRLAHVQAVDNALKKLALADASRESDSRGYDMT